MASSQDENRTLSAYEKAADAGIDPRCVSQKLLEPVPEDDKIIYPDYPQSDHEVWKFLYERQMNFLQGKVCDEYLTGVEKLKFTPGKIPALRDLSAVFKKNTGWTLARVPGLIDVDDFFALLKRKVFPSTD